MKKLLLSISVILGGILLGCDDYLDIRPKGYTIPEYYDDYQTLMYGLPLHTTSNSVINYMTDHTALLDKDGDSDLNMVSKWEYIRNLYQFKPGAIYLPGNSDAFWEKRYENIFTYNVVINNVMDAPDATDSQKSRLRAEALIGRAMEYLFLVNGYAVHYQAATAKSDLGVPLILSEDINNSYRRNSVQEVYDQIEKDIIEALPSLAEKALHVYQATQAVGQSLLARTYLYMGKYKEALIYAENVLKVHNTLLDFKAFNSREGGWDHIYDANGELFPVDGNNPEDFFFRLDISDLSAELCASEDLIDCYHRNLEADMTDQRLALFYFKDRANPWREMLFPGKYMWAAYHTQNVGFSTPEILLIAAECEARIGSKEKAMEYIGHLRDYRIINNRKLTASDKEEALKIILDERRREMPFTGMTRYIDLKRLNLEEKFRKTVIHTADGKTFTLPPNDPRYVLPIPPKVLEQNPDIPQYKR